MRNFLITLLFVLCIAAIKEESNLEVIRIDGAIEFLLSKGLPAHKIFPHPRHTLLKKPEKRLEVSEAIYRAAHAKRVPAPLLIATGFREGSFKEASIGKLGELSMFQMVPQTMKMARKLDSRCSPYTLEGSAFCSATWLAHWKEKCGTWRKSLAIYATGHTCNPEYSSHVEWLTRDRLGIARKLSKKFWKETSL